MALQRKSREFRDPMGHCVEIESVRNEIGRHFGTRRPSGADHEKQRPALMRPCPGCAEEFPIQAQGRRATSIACCTRDGTMPLGTVPMGRPSRPSPSQAGAGGPSASAGHRRGDSPSLSALGLMPRAFRPASWQELGWLQLWGWSHARAGHGPRARRRNRATSS